MNLQQKNHRLMKRATCILYTNPLAGTTLPVFTDTTLTWNPTCSVFTSALVDIYISISTADGSKPVHLFKGLDYKSGQYTTQFNPGWWNATTGAGSVQAQLVFTPTGNAIWDTSAPASSLFTISYNGSYPSATATAFQPLNTGPAVQSADSTVRPSIATGTLVAAVIVPVIFLAAGLVAYIFWNRRRKQPEKKRWSAAIDKRMSMMSERTWQPPRPSMSSSGAGLERPSASYYRNSVAGGSPGSANSPLRTSQFYADGRPASNYSLTPANHIRPAAHGDMRQIGSGDRVSRVSFVGQERSLTAVGGKARSSIYGGRSPNVGANGRPSTMHRNSMGGASFASDTVSPTRINRSGTTEELSNEAFAAFVAQQDRRPYAVASSPTTVSSSASPTGSSSDESPFADPRRLQPPLAAHMPMAARDSLIMSPDEALRSYAVKRDAGVVSPTPSGTNSSKPSFGTIVRSASSFLNPRRLKSIMSSNSLSASAAAPYQRESAPSPPLHPEPVTTSSSPSHSPTSASSPLSALPESSYFDHPRPSPTPPSVASTPSPALSSLVGSYTRRVKSPVYSEGDSDGLSSEEREAEERKRRMTQGSVYSTTEEEEAEQQRPPLPFPGSNQYPRY